MTHLKATAPKPQEQRVARPAGKRERAIPVENADSYTVSGAPKRAKGDTSAPSVAPSLGMARSSIDLRQLLHHAPRRLRTREPVPGSWRPLSQESQTVSAPEPAPDPVMSASPEALCAAVLTPGGAAWWKFAGQAPGPLHDVYAASISLYRHSLLPMPAAWPSPSESLRDAAFLSDVDRVRRLLGQTSAQLQARYHLSVAALAGTPRDTEQERMELKSDTQLMSDSYRLQAMVYALVGRGGPDEKQATLRMLLCGGLDKRLADVRMLGMNLLHIACIAPMPTGHRVAMIRFLKGCGIEPESVGESGLTPVHCAATQPDAMYICAALFERTYPLQINKHAPDKAGRTPLDYATWAQPKDDQIIKWLSGSGLGPRTASVPSTSPEKRVTARNPELAEPRMRFIPTP